MPELKSTDYKAYSKFIENLAKKLDVIINKELNGEVLSNKELRRKKIYDVNSNAIGTYLSNLERNVIVPIKILLSTLFFSKICFKCYIRNMLIALTVHLI